MSNFYQDGINFTIEDNFNNNEKRQVINGKLTSAANDYSGYGESGPASFLINCVDIDWNKGELPQSAFTINNDVVTFNGQQIIISNTGELLMLIDMMSKKIKSLSARINELKSLIDAN